MKNIFKKIFTVFYLLLVIMPGLAFAQELREEAQSNEGEQNPVYLQAVISIDEAVEVQKSSIFDASDSFIPNAEQEINFYWDFGDGNKNEGTEAMEVLHAYKEPGRYTVSLTVDDGINTSTETLEIFAYRKLIFLMSDQTEAQERINVIKDYAEEQGVFIKIIDSFGSSTEFISEEILTKKLNEESNIFQKSGQIVIWTKENAGLNSLSRYLQANQAEKNNLSQQTITVLENNVNAIISRIQNQFQLIKPKSVIVAKEAAIYPLIESQNDKEFIYSLETGGYEYEIITEETGKLRPWNFMSYLVNFLINTGIPDNTIALLLLLPVIATVIAFMKQFVGLTTFGIYTPSIMTLSFLVIGLPAGLLTLFAAIIAGAIARPILKKIRMLYIPKMALVITFVSLVLFLILIFSVYLQLFDSAFLSIAIFPMLILSTLVEKLISVKSEKGLSSAIVLMGETVLVAIIAYFLAGGEINFGFTTIQLSLIKRIIITYPEIILLLFIANIILGKWSGLRLLERLRFREILRHIEE
ncbi:PKD domain-containing protein [Candidatus Peregrinibacteria bacterium]|nr:PKD domain-containing protein [Candidatus Peregrinibacteria bacterium]